MDFTVKTYKKLLNTLSDRGFSFQTFKEYCSNPQDRVIVLRHDVDLLPDNSLRFAGIQAEMGIKGTYYFRIVPESFDEKIIKEIYALGHEVGYHYEDLGSTAQRYKGVKVRVTEGQRDGGTKGRGDRETKGRRDEETKRRRDEETKREEELAKIAIESFQKNLERLRSIVPVDTICMHGSPMSKWDSRLLWKYYDYRDFGIIGEPYFDINFDEVFYLTDTGRRWNGDSFNVRDKASGIRRHASGGRRDGVTEGRREEETEGLRDRETEGLREEETKGRREEETKRRGDGETIRRRNEIPKFGNPITQTAPDSYRDRTPFPKFHSTFDIIKAAESGHLPDKIMMTFHPQRWTDNPVPWVKELVWQNFKNRVKYFIVRKRKD